MTTVARSRIPLPEPSPLTMPFWAACQEHRLVVQRCRECGAWEWTPQLICSHCLRDALEWTPVSGRGVVYTFSVVRRPQMDAFEAPYVVAEIEIEEGPRLLSNVVGIAPDDVRIGLAVEVGFEDFEQISLFNFRPRAAD
jgi:uncharacterized OB-fold protein